MKTFIRPGDIVRFGDLQGYVASGTVQRDSAGYTHLVVFKDGSRFRFSEDTGTLIDSEGARLGPPLTIVQANDANITQEQLRAFVNALGDLVEAMKKVLR